MTDRQDRNHEHDYKRGPALCGLRPAHGWAGDLFADEMCERCYQRCLKDGIPLADWLRRSVLATRKAEEHLYQKLEQTHA